MSSHISQLFGNTPLIPIRKLVKPHKISTSLCKIYAKCEFRNPSGSIWDRRVCHAINKELENCSAFVTGGISDLCLSLAWAGATVFTSSNDNLIVAVFPGDNLEDCKLQLLHGFGVNVIFSYQQDHDKINTKECLEEHMKTFEDTSGVPHHRILPFITPTSLQESDTGNNNPYDGLVEEVSAPEYQWDMVVCSSQDLCLLQSLRKRFSSPEETIIIGVEFTGNAFTETFTDTETLPDIKIVHISDAECYDMARRLIREEGLMVGPISGGIMAAAIKEILLSPSTPPPPSVLVILPDSLQNTSREFLSVDWMVQKGYYSGSHLESLFWWYEMAIENLSPPEILTAPPEASIKSVLTGMNASSTERCVVVANTSTGGKHAIGVVTRDSLDAKRDTDESATIGDACTKQFGVIDSKANFSELERLLRKYNWVVNMHRITSYSSTTSTSGDNQLVLQTNEDVLGAVNMADFIRYKRKVEKHHLTEFGLVMSDGLPSSVWLERLNEHLNISQQD